MTDFSKRLTKYRKAAAISQEKLAEMLGVSRQAVSKWETAETQPEMANLMALCEILKVSPNQLMGWETELEQNIVPANVTRKMSKLVVATVILCVCAALAAGIFIGRSSDVSKTPAGPLDGKESMEITGFFYEFNPAEKEGEIKLTIMPGIADENLEYEVIRIGGSGGNKTYQVEYEEGICTAYVETVLYDEVVYTLKVSDGYNVIHKPLFKVYAHDNNHWSHEEVWME